MKIILKILAAPIVVALALLIWLCSAFLYTLLDASGYLLDAVFG